MESNIIQTQLPIVDFIYLLEEIKFINNQAKIANKDDFKDKGNLLNTMGFTNSITTLMYSEIADKQSDIKYYNNKYINNIYLVKSQVDYIYNKYDLFERELSEYNGEIPIINMEHLSNFKFDLRDFKISLLIENKEKEYFLSENILNILDTSDINLLNYEEILLIRLFNSKIKNTYKFLEDIKSAYSDQYIALCNMIRSLISLSSHKNISLNLLQREIQNINNSFKSIRVNNNHIINFKLLSPLKIAANKELFDNKSFERYKDRIIEYSNKPFINPSVKVVDPIVSLITANNGRLIITSWGKESNDELIKNNK